MNHMLRAAFICISFRTGIRQWDKRFSSWIKMLNHFTCAQTTDTQKSRAFGLSTIYLHKIVKKVAPKSTEIFIEITCTVWTVNDVLSRSTPFFPKGYGSTQKGMDWLKSKCTLPVKMFGPFWSVCCKMALAEVGVSLSWWCPALALLPPGYWSLF